MSSMMRNNNNIRDKAAKTIQRFFRKSRSKRQSHRNPDASIPRVLTRQSRYWRRTYDFPNYCNPTAFVQQTTGYQPPGSQNQGFTFICLKLPFLLDGGTDTVANQGFTYPALLPNRGALAGEFDEFNLSHIDIEVVPMANFFPNPILNDDSALGIGYAYGTQAKHGLTPDTNSDNVGLFSTGGFGYTNASVSQALATQLSFYSYAAKKMVLSTKTLRYKFFPSTLASPSNFPGYPASGYTPSYQLYNLWFPLGAVSSPPLGLVYYFLDLMPCYCGGSGLTQGVAVLSFVMNLRLHFTFRKFR